jgi:hypothetical protein
VIVVANQRLIHDVAFATSRQILEVVAPCLREEEQRDAFAEIYERIKAGIECFELRSNRMASRLLPGNN